MKYDHAVIYNGVLYPTGAEIPETDAPEKTASAPETDVPSKKAVTKRADKGTA